MKLTIFERPADAAAAAATLVAVQLRDQPASVLGLPTGRTSLGIYDELVRLHEAGAADFSRAHTLNLDEFVGLPSTDRRSYCAFMQTHLFRRVNIPPAHVHFLDGRAADVEAECLRYERLIDQLGGIDLQLLGVGANGHIGFNEPARTLHARTHRARLTVRTRRANAPLFRGRLREVPREALSMGMATILHARRIVLMATGASKAAAVARMVQGPVTPRVPASFLQLHRHAEVWLDRAAAGRLKDG